MPLSAESISFSAHHAERFLAWNSVYQNLASSESHTSPHTKKRKKSEYKRAVTNTNRRFVFPYATDCEFKMRRKRRRGRRSKRRKRRVRSKRRKLLKP